MASLSFTKFFGPLLNICQNLPRDGDILKSHLQGWASFPHLGFLPFHSWRCSYVSFSNSTPWENCFRKTVGFRGKGCMERKPASPKEKLGTDTFPYMHFLRELWHQYTYCLWVLQNSIIKQTFVECLLGVRHKSHVLIRVKKVSRGL